MRNIYKLFASTVIILSFLISSAEAQVVANFNPTIASDGCGIATYELKDISTCIGIPIDLSQTYFTWSLLKFENSILEVLKALITKKLIL